MTITIQLLDSPKDIEYKILREIAIVANQKIISKLGRIQDDIRKEAYNQLILSDTYTALLDGGVLAAIFGFRPGEGGRKAISIITQLTSLINVVFTTFTLSGSTFSGGLTINIVPDDLDSKTWAGDDFIRINDGYFFAIPWLKTLLFEGDYASFAINYDVKFGAGLGRSGEAEMMPSTSQWMMPVSFAGTSKNNWFTRELQAQAFQDSLSNILQNVLQ